MELSPAIRLLILVAIYFLVLGTLVSVVHHIAHHQVAAKNKDEKQHHPGNF